MDDENDDNSTSNSELVQNLSDEQAQRSVVVSNVPPGTERDQLYIHFQRKQNGGGDIDSLVMLSEDKAIVTFDEDNVAVSILQKQQNFKGTILHLEPYTKEETPPVSEMNSASTSDVLPKPDTHAQLPAVLTHTLESGVIVSVYQADITQQHVDAIVNAANECLEYGGGLAGAIIKQGGYQIQIESRQLVQRLGPVPVGQVAHTAPGKLPCKRILHAVGPPWSVHGPDAWRELIWQACFKSLLIASQFGYRSIALPAISSGIFGVPREICAEMLFTAAEAFSCEVTSNNQLKDIRFVNIDFPTNEVFRKEFHKRYLNKGTDSKGTGNNNKDESTKKANDEQKTVTKDGGIPSNAISSEKTEPPKSYAAMAAIRRQKGLQKTPEREPGSFQKGFQNRQIETKNKIPDVKTGKASTEKTTENKKDDKVSKENKDTKSKINENKEDNKTKGKNHGSNNDSKGTGKNNRDASKKSANDEKKTAPKDAGGIPSNTTSSEKSQQAKSYAAMAALQQAEESKGEPGSFQKGFQNRQIETKNKIPDVKTGKASTEKTTENKKDDKVSKENKDTKSKINENKEDNKTKGKNHGSNNDSKGTGKNNRDASKKSANDEKKTAPKDADGIPSNATSSEKSQQTKSYAAMAALQQAEESKAEPGSFQKGFQNRQIETKNKIPDVKTGKASTEKTTENKKDDKVSKENKDTKSKINENKEDNKTKGKNHGSNNDSKGTGKNNRDASKKSANDEKKTAPKDADGIPSNATSSEKSQQTKSYAAMAALQQAEESKAEPGSFQKGFQNRQIETKNKIPDVKTGKASTEKTTENKKDDKVSKENKDTKSKINENKEDNKTKGKNHGSNNDSKGTGKNNRDASKKSANDEKKTAPKDAGGIPSNATSSEKSQQAKSYAAMAALQQAEESKAEPGSFQKGFQNRQIETKIKIPDVKTGKASTEKTTENKKDDKVSKENKDTKSKINENKEDNKTKGKNHGSNNDSKGTGKNNRDASKKSANDEKKTAPKDAGGIPSNATSSEKSQQAKSYAAMAALQQAEESKAEPGSFQKGFQNRQIETKNKIPDVKTGKASTEKTTENKKDDKVSKENKDTKSKINKNKEDNKTKGKNHGSNNDSKGTGKNNRDASKKSANDEKKTAPKDAGGIPSNATSSEKSQQAKSYAAMAALQQAEESKAEPGSFQKGFQNRQIETKNKIPDVKTGKASTEKTTENKKDDKVSKENKDTKSKINENKEDNKTKGKNHGSNNDSKGTGKNNRDASKKSANDEKKTAPKDAGGIPSNATSSEKSQQAKSYAAMAALQQAEESKGEPGSFQNGFKKRHNETKNDVKTENKDEEVKLTESGYVDNDHQTKKLQIEVTPQEKTDYKTSDSKDGSDVIVTDKSTSNKSDKNLPKGTNGLSSNRNGKTCTYKGRGRGAIKVPANLTTVPGAGKRVNTPSDKQLDDHQETSEPGTEHMKSHYEDSETTSSSTGQQQDEPTAAHQPPQPTDEQQSKENLHSPQSNASPPGLQVTKEGLSLAAGCKGDGTDEKSSPLQDGVQGSKYIKRKIEENSSEKSPKQRKEEIETVSDDNMEQNEDKNTQQQNDEDMKKIMPKCEHQFCRSCIDEAFKHNKKCPICGTAYGVQTGHMHEQHARQEAERKVATEQQTLQQVERQRAEAERQVATERQTLRQVERQRAEAERQVATERQTLQQVERQRAEAERQVATEQQTLQRVERQRAEAERQVATERETLRQVERQRAEAERQVAIERQTLQQVGRQRAEAERQVATEQQTSQQVKRQRAEAERQVAIERQTLQQVERQRAEAERQVATEQQTSQQVKRQRAEAERQVATERKTLQQVERQRAEAERQVATERQTLQQVERQRAEAERQVATERQTLQQVERQRAEAERQVATEQQTLQRVERQRAEAEAEAETQIQRMQERANEQEERYNQLVSEARDWVLNREEIFLSDKIIGRGSWGEVVEGKFRGTTVAVKRIHQVILSQRNRSRFEREMNMASRCRHPCLLQFIGATAEDSSSPLFVTELMDTSLRALLHHRILLQSGEVFAIALDVARALNYLHLNRPDPIIHRDISSGNVLLTRHNDSWRAKLSDYGSTNFIQQCVTLCPGAPMYSAPEAVNFVLQTPKIDVYSFGVLLFEMNIPEEPDATRRNEQVAMVTNQCHKTLISRCIQQKPEDRPSMEEIIDILEQAKGMVCQ